MDRPEVCEKSDTLLEVKDLKMYFDVNNGLFKTQKLKAVDGVSFTVKRGETLGVVGESGCGKTTLGRTIMFLYKPTGGEIVFNGKPVKTKADVRQLRTKLQMVFQDPYSSLDPRMTVSDIIAEPLDAYKLYSSKQERAEKVKSLMDAVGLSAEHATRYAQFWGIGQGFYTLTFEWLCRSVAMIRPRSYTTCEATHQEPSSSCHWMISLFSSTKSSVCASLTSTNALSRSG